MTLAMGALDSRKLFSLPVLAFELYAFDVVAILF